MTPAAPVDAAADPRSGPGANPAPHLPYSPALDGLRALAVTAVVVFHLKETGLTGGFLGVDAFFVLSGFLITTLLVLEWRRRSSIGLTNFWARRARRLLPALILMMIVVAVFAYFATPTDELHRLRWDGIAGLFYVANWRFIASGQSYFDLFTSPSPFRHLWSLAIEEQFYLVWPLVALACLKLGRGRLRVLGIVALVGAVVSTALMAGLFDPADASRAYYGTDTHAHPILVGVLLAVVLVDRPAFSARVQRWLDVIGVVALVGMFAAFAFAHDTSPRLYRGGSLLFAVCVALVITAMMRAPGGLVGRAFSLRPFVAVGVVSYGIYLWHWPVIVEITGDRVGLHGFPLALVRIGITAAAAIGSYVFLERPIRRGFRTRWSWVAAPAGIAAGVVALLLGTAAATATPSYLSSGPATPTSSTTLAAATPGDPKEVVMVGDSLALSLAPGLDDAFAQQGVPFHVAATSGCSVIRGVTMKADGSPYPWSKACDGAITPALQQVVSTEPKPDLVLWLSTWDGVDRTVDGKTVRIDTPGGRRTISAEVKRSADLLAAQGARVMILTVPPPTPGSTSVLPGLDETSRIDAINRVYREAASTAAGEVRVLDFSAIICPGGKCRTKAGGVELRPDGSHFSTDGSKVIGTELSTAVLECWHDPNRCR